MFQIRRALWALSLLFGCETRTEPNHGIHDAEPLKLQAQRVTGTVKREAPRLLRIETEHETFTTTPEHPFATVRAGWVAAGRLVPGDLLVSAKSETRQVLSVRSEKPARPVTVFNLSVDRSHAYFVGTEQVLVHNTGCADPQDPVATKEREIQELEHQLKAREETPAAERDAQHEQRIAELKNQLQREKKNLSNARYRQKKKAPAGEGPKEDPLERNTREKEAAERELEALQREAATPAGSNPETQRRIAGLERARKQAMRNAAQVVRRDKRKRGEGPSGTYRERLLQQTEANSQSVTKAREIQELERQLKALEETQPAPDRDAEHEQRIAELKNQIKREKRNLTNALSRQKKKALAGKGPKEDPLVRNTREKEAAERELEALQREAATPGGLTPKTQQRIAELKQARTGAMKNLARIVRKDKRKHGEGPSGSYRERLLQQTEANSESVRNALEQAQSELRELQDQTPQTEAEAKSLARRRAELEKKVKALQYEDKKTNELLSWETRLVELENLPSSPRGDPLELEREKRELKTKIGAERERRYARRSFRERDDPERLAKKRAKVRAANQRRYRTADYVADTERPRDTLELMEEELAERGGEPGSTSAPARIDHLAERTEMLREQVRLRRAIKKAARTLSRARIRRAELVRRGADTAEIDRRMAPVEQGYVALRRELVKAVAIQILLGKIDDAGPTGEPHEVEEPRLAEFESELTGPAGVDENRLGEIERELDAESLSAEFFEEAWREAAAREAGLEETVPPETLNIDDVLGNLDELLRDIPSPLP